MSYFVCLANRSNEFANFLTVSRKYGVTCVYIFHTIYPTRQNWQMIISQTKIFNFFQGLFKLVQYREYYILLPLCRATIMSLHKTFGLMNSILTYLKVKQCLTVDTPYVNNLGPEKFRTEADSRTEQTCYCNKNKKDTNFDSFLATRKKTSPSKINFSIVKVTDNVNKNDSINFDTDDELSGFKNDIVQQTIQRVSESNTARKTTSKQQYIRRRRLPGYGQVSKKPRFLS